MNERFQNDFNEYLKHDPQYYQYFTDSSYYELADWYNTKYAPELASEKNIPEAYEFAKWAFDKSKKLLEEISSIDISKEVYPYSCTRDHTVYIRERYAGKIDFDKWLEYKDNDLFNLACKTIGFEPNSFKYEEESCMSRMPQVDYDRLRVGDLLWYRNIEDARPKFEEVVITHIYGGVVFLRYTKRDDKNEFWLPKESSGYYLGLYPKKVILPKGTKCTCDCELTEFEEESEVLHKDSGETSKELKEPTIKD